MIKICGLRIPSRKKRLLAFIIHYFLKAGFYFYRCFRKGTSQYQNNLPLPLNKIKKVLIIRLDFLGDIVMSTPAFKALRKIFPDAHLTLLSANLSKELVEVMPTFDEIIYFDAPWFLKTKSQNLSRLFNIIKKLRKSEFDLAIDLRGDFRHNILMYLSNITYRLGFGVTGCDFLLTHIVHGGNNLHAVALSLSLIKYLNPKDNGEHNLSLWITKEDLKYAVNFYNNIDYEENGNLVVIIHPGASRNIRKWKCERYAQVADCLIEKYKTKVVLAGGPDDSESVQTIANLMKHPCIKVGKTSLRQFLAVLGQSDLFIGLDSGPMHMATAMRVKVVALFGPALPEAVGPWSNDSIVVTHQKDFICSPCDQTVCKNRGNRCMDAIQADEVLEAAETQLKRIVLERESKNIEKGIIISG